MIIKCALSLVLLQLVFAVDFPVDQLNQFLDAVEQEPAHHNVALQQNVGEQLIALQPQNGIYVTDRLLELIRNTRVSDHLYALFVELITSEVGRQTRAYVIDILRTLRQTRDVQWALRCVQDGVCRLPSVGRYLKILLARDSTSMALFCNQIMPMALIMMALYMRFTNRPLNAIAQLLISALYISIILFTTLLTMTTDFGQYHDKHSVMLCIMQMGLVSAFISISEDIWIGSFNALGIPQGLFMRNNEVFHGWGAHSTRLSVNDHFVDTQITSADEECQICREEFEASEMAKRPRCSRNMYLHNKCLCEWLITNPKCLICNTYDKYSEGQSGDQQFVEEQSAELAERQEFDPLRRDEQT
ncbi:hypothetical protein MP228_007979 [Amoeboaphelidium protococcarum]|nr:hypothetical protein MP228_007979 [Amoeboaphelidium protococcarum]